MNPELKAELVLDSRVASNGKTESAPLKAPSATATVRFEVDVTAFDDPNTVVEFGIEVSWDDGATWEHLMSGSRPGGLLGEDKQPLPIVALEMTFGEKTRRPDKKTHFRTYTAVTGFAVALGAGKLEAR